jgi:hypothetical protein
MFPLKYTRRTPFGASEGEGRVKRKNKEKEKKKKESEKDCNNICY